MHRIVAAARDDLENPAFTANTLGSPGDRYAHQAKINLDITN
ncbi:hypothetical protein [Leptolyngbya iicbica]|nr:hypothetical protein [Leptolyngbya sp. LK]